MADPFVGEIRMVPFNFAPKGWAFCDGQIMPISQNTALFSLLENRYGGDGMSTYALPNLKARTAAPGLSLRSVGASGGEEAVALSLAEMPAHTHVMPVSNNAATTGTPSASNALAVTGATVSVYGPAANLVSMGDGAGGGLPHNNRRPYLVVSFIIALQGVFPARS